jgi:hypothetical protein
LAAMHPGRRSDAAVLVGLTNSGGGAMNPGPRGRIRPPPGWIYYGAR